MNPNHVVQDQPEGCQGRLVRQADRGLPVGTHAGPVHPVVDHLNAQDAADLLTAQAARARLARAAAGDNDQGRWMESR